MARTKIIVNQLDLTNTQLPAGVIPIDINTIGITFGTAIPTVGQFKVKYLNGIILENINTGNITLTTTNNDINLISTNNILLKKTDNFRILLDQTTSRLLIENNTNSIDINALGQGFNLTSRGSGSFIDTQYSGGLRLYTKNCSGTYWYIGYSGGINIFDEGLGNGGILVNLTGVNNGIRFYNDYSSFISVCKNYFNIISTDSYGFISANAGLTITNQTSGNIDIINNGGSIFITGKEGIVKISHEGWNAENYLEFNQNNYTTTLRHNGAGLKIDFQNSGGLEFRGQISAGVNYNIGNSGGFNIQDYGYGSGGFNVYLTNSWINISCNNSYLRMYPPGGVEIRDGNSNSFLYIYPYGGILLYNGNNGSKLYIFEGGGLELSDNVYGSRLYFGYNYIDLKAGWNYGYLAISEYYLILNNAYKNIEFNNVLKQIYIANYEDYGSIRIVETGINGEIFLYSKYITMNGIILLRNEQFEGDILIENMYNQNNNIILTTQHGGGNISLIGNGEIALQSSDKVRVICDLEFEQNSQGIILKSRNNNIKYRIYVDDSGNLLTEIVS